MPFSWRAEGAGHRYRPCRGNNQPGQEKGRRAGLDRDLPGQRRPALEALVGEVRHVIDSRLRPRILGRGPPPLRQRAGRCTEAGRTAFPGRLQRRGAWNAGGRGARQRRNCTLTPPSARVGASSLSSPPGPRSAPTRSLSTRPPDGDGSQPITGPPSVRRSARVDRRVSTGTRMRQWNREKPAHWEYSGQKRRSSGSCFDRPEAGAANKG